MAKFTAATSSSATSSSVDSGRGASGGGYRAIVFLDVVGSCGLKSELGEQRYFDDVEAPYLEIVRRVLAAVPCREHNDTGDGKLLTFERVEDAVRAALLIQAELRAAPWRGEPSSVRIGIHGGETRTLPGGEIRGHNVDLCARLTSLSLPGQILLTRHVYDDARRFVTRHPTLTADASQDTNTALRLLDPNDQAGPPPPLIWRNHGAYPFRGFTQRFEVCEVGAEGFAPDEPPPMPSAASTTDRAFKLTESVLRLVRQHPLRSLAAALLLVAAVAYGVSYVWNATQRLPAGSTLPGQALESTRLHELDTFRENDDEVWFMQLVGRYEADARPEKVPAQFRKIDANPSSAPGRDPSAHVSVFLSDALPFSQSTLEFTADTYRGFDIHVTAILLRPDGWMKVLRSPRDFTEGDGVLNFHLTHVERGSELRIVLFAAKKLVPLPDPSGLKFTVR